MTLNLSTGTYTLQFRSHQQPYGFATMLDNVRLQELSHRSAMQAGPLVAECGGVLTTVGLDGTASGPIPTATP